MDLHYSVIIDTDKAESATEELSQLFDKMGQSADKSANKVAQFGNDLVNDLKGGTLTTQEAVDSIEALRTEIQRMAKAGKFAGKDSKQFASQTLLELQKLQKQIKQIEREETNAHKREQQRTREQERADAKAHKEKMRQLREEQRQRERMARAERREQVMNKRAIVWQNRALKKAGATEISGGIGWLLGATKFGGIGGISTVLAGAVSVISRYKDEVTEIYKMGGDFLNNMWWYFDYIIGGLKSLWSNIKNFDFSDFSWGGLNKYAQNAANERAFKEYDKEERKEKAEIIEWIKTLTDVSKGSARNTAWEELLKKEAFKDKITNADFEKYKNNATQLRKWVDEYYEQGRLNKALSLYSDKDNDALYEKMLKDKKSVLQESIANLEKEKKELTEESVLLEKHESLRSLKEAIKTSANKVELENKYLDDLDFYKKEDTKNIDEQLKKVNKELDELNKKQVLAKIADGSFLPNGLKKVAVGNIFKDDEGRVEEIRKEYKFTENDLTEEGKRQFELLRKRDEREAALEKEIRDEEAKKAAERLKKEREQNIRTLRSMAMKDTSPYNVSDYEKGLWEIEDKKRDSLAKLEQLKGKFKDKEYTELYEQAHKVILDNAEKATNKLNADFTKIYEETLKTFKDELNGDKWELAGEKLKDKYKAQIESVEKTFGKDDERARALRTQLEINEAIEEENLLLSEEMENVDELGKKRQDELEIEMAGMSNREFEQRNRFYELDIKRLEIQKDINTAKINYLETQKSISDEEQRMIDQLKTQNKLIDAQVKKFAKEREEIEKTDWGGVVGTIGGSVSGSSNGYARGIGSAMQGIGSNYNTMQSRRNYYTVEYEDGTSEQRSSGYDSASAEEYAQAASQLIDFAIDAYDGIEASKDRCKETLDEWNDLLENSAHRLAMLNIEQWEFQQKNMFGVEDPYNKLYSLLNQSKEAQKATTEAVEKLGIEGRVQVGWGTEHEEKTMAEYIGGGAATGATVGTAAYAGIGTAIGAVVGAIAGGIVGYFASEDLYPIYNSIAGKYGSANIYNKETLEINKDILADYDEMDDKTKQWIDDLQELLDVQKEIKQEWDDYILGLVGDLGANIENTLYEAFAGDRMHEAVGDMKAYLTDTLSGILRREVFNNIFEANFTSLSNQLRNGMVDQNGNLVGDVSEIVAGFLPSMESGLQTYQALMEQMQAKFKEYGFDIFGGETTASQEALQGGITSMTEDTASRLNGNFMGLKLSALEISDKVSSIRAMFSDANQIANNSLTCLREIADNTAFCQRLDTMANDIADLRRNGIQVR